VRFTIDVPIRPVADVMILDIRTLDTIACCLDHLAGISGLSVAECLLTLEEYSQPLTRFERAQILVWYDFRYRMPAQIH
jgi:hypothetical protein